MKPVMLMTAEYASVSSDGKLSIMGIFDSIQAASFPASSPRMYLVAQFKAEPEEYGRRFDVMFQMHNSNGDTLVQLNGMGEVPDSEHNLTVLMNQVVTLNNISFEAPGSYVFSVHVDGVEAATLPFSVVSMKKPSNQV